MRLEERNLTRLQSLDLLFVGVYTRDLVPQKSQAGSGGQTHVSGTDNRNIHIVKGISILAVLPLSAFLRASTNLNKCGELWRSSAPPSIVASQTQGTSTPSPSPPTLFLLSFPSHSF